MANHTNKKSVDACGMVTIDAKMWTCKKVQEQTLIEPIFPDHQHTNSPTSFVRYITCLEYFPNYLPLISLDNPSKTRCSSERSIIKYQRRSNKKYTNKARTSQQLNENGRQNQLLRDILALQDHNSSAVSFLARNAKGSSSTAMQQDSILNM